MLKRVKTFEEIAAYPPHVKDLPQCEEDLRTALVYRMTDRTDVTKGFYILRPCQKNSAYFVLDIFVFESFRGKINYRSHARSILRQFFLKMKVEGILSHTLNKSAEKLLRFFGFEELSNNWFLLKNGGLT